MSLRTNDAFIKHIDYWSVQQFFNLTTEMYMRIILKVFSICLAAFLIGCGSSSSDTAITKPFEPVACPEVSTYTAIQGSSFKLINEPHEFVELYLATDLNSQDEAPLIDFETKSIVAIHLGEKPSGGHQVQVTSVEDFGPKIVVRYEAVSPGNGCNVVTVITNPYCFVSISKTTKPVEFIATNVRKCGS